MPAQLIDGIQLSQQLRGEIAQRAAKLGAEGRQPGLAVILVGEDPASQVYVRNKVKACADVGFHSLLGNTMPTCPKPPCSTASPR